MLQSGLLWSSWLLVKESSDCFDLKQLTVEANVEGLSDGVHIMTARY